jgi:tRNA A37 threonylcarbamoyladenosine dehydratase
MNETGNPLPEQFYRTLLVYGVEGMQRIRAAHVVVVGLGAVGSYAVEALARAGVGRLRLVDFDVVGPSNLNRQLYALHSTLGQFKADLACQRVKDINPVCDVQALKLRVMSDHLKEVLAGSPDLVVDAIDQIDAKVELIAGTRHRKVPIISSMGAARRTDPARICVALLSETQGCPLARSVRIRLRRIGVALDVPCVYSTEPPVKPALGLFRGADSIKAGDQRSPKSRRALGSLPTLTGIVGLTMAHAALRMLLSQPTSPS